MIKLMKYDEIKLVTGGGVNAWNVIGVVYDATFNGLFTAAAGATMYDFYIRRRRLNAREGAAISEAAAVTRTLRFATICGFAGTGLSVFNSIARQASNTTTSA